LPVPRLHISSNVAQNDLTGGNNEERWKAFFMFRKIRHFDNVPATDTFHLKVKANPPNKINYC